MKSTSAKKKNKKFKIEKTEDEGQSQESKGNQDVDMTAEGENKKEDQTAEEKEGELRKREEYKRQERELIEEIQKYSSIRSEEPLGLDRIYNRYWSFRNVDGLLIEADDDAKILAENIGEDEEDEMEEEFTDETSAKVFCSRFVS